MSKFVHMELSTSDPAAAQKFYKGIFGWSYQKMKMADGSVYTSIATAEGEGIGGMQQNPNPGVPPNWLGYVSVDSIKRTTAKVEKRGGKVVLPQMPIDDMGWIAIYSDPQGAVFGVWQQAAPKPAAAAAVEQAAPAKKASKKAAKKAPAKKASKKAAKK